MNQDLMFLGTIIIGAILIRIFHKDEPSNFLEV